jgi:hypothetical protein
MTLVLNVLNVYNIVTDKELEPPPHDIDFNDQTILGAKAKTIIHLSCSLDIQFLLKSHTSLGTV